MFIVGGLILSVLTIVHCRKDKGRMLVINKKHFCKKKKGRGSSLIKRVSTIEKDFIKKENVLCLLMIEEKEAMFSCDK